MHTQQFSPHQLHRPHLDRLHGPREEAGVCGDVDRCAQRRTRPFITSHCWPDDCQPRHLFQRSIRTSKQVLCAAHADHSLEVGLSSWCPVKTTEPPLYSRPTQQDTKQPRKVLAGCKQTVTGECIQENQNGSGVHLGHRGEGIGTQGPGWGRDCGKKGLSKGG